MPRTDLWAAYDKLTAQRDRLKALNTETKAECARLRSAKEQAQALNGELVEALEALSDEAPNSVEYSDWPELQKAVEQARAVLDKARA